MDKIQGCFGKIWTKRKVDVFSLKKLDIYSRMDKNKILTNKNEAL